jgi:hypothetical protein
MQSSVLFGQPSLGMFSSNDSKDHYNKMVLNLSHFVTACFCHPMAFPDVARSNDFTAKDKGV